MSRFSPVLAVFLTVLAAVGCGGRSPAGAPASLVPADASIYLELRVRPTGAVHDKARAAAAKLVDAPEPGPKLQALLDTAFGGRATYERDIAPWLGERAGIWVSGLETDQPSVALILQATDTEAAKAALDRGIAHVGAGEKAGVIGDFVVIAPAREFARAEQVDGRGEKASLAGTDRYRKALDPLPGERIGHFFADTAPILRAALDTSGIAGADLLRGVLPTSLPPTAGALIADGDRLAVDVYGGGKDAGALLDRLRGGGKTSELVKELPGDAWAAIGIPRLGSTARAAITSVAGGFGLAALSVQVQAQTGLDLEEDLLDWIGDAAVYVRGEAPAIGGALVIGVTDPGKAATAFGKLAALARTQAGATVEPVAVPGAESAFTVSGLGGTEVVVLARTEKRVVVGYGMKATEAVLRPATHLADAPQFAEAGQTLGDGLEPAGLLDVETIIGLVDREAAPGDPGWARARTYLDGLSVITLGSESGAGGRTRVAAGFR